jgi:hypothetical protein
MGKLINLGWSNAGDVIPQPIGIVFGSRLRQNSKEPSPKPTPNKSRTARPAPDLPRAE